MSLAYQRRFIISSIVALSCCIASCENDSNAPESCESKEAYCDQNKLMSWDCESMSYKAQDCPLGCEADHCIQTSQSECQDDFVSTCDGDDHVKVCQGGQIVSQECELGCEQGKCRACTSSDGLTCADATHKSECVSGQIVTSKCDYQCDGNQCIQAPTCQDDDKPSCADAKTRVFCEGGAAKSETCDYRCVDGICQPPECLDEAFTPVCNADGKTLKVCKNNAFEEETCGYKCEGNACVDPICWDSEKPSCADSKTLKTCKDFNYVTETCDYRCQMGECVKAPCTLGQTRCGNGDTDDETGDLFECQQAPTTGLIDWQKKMNCHDIDMICDTKLKSCQVCSLDKWKCASGTETLQQCKRNASGDANEWTDMLDCAAKDKVCDATYRGCKICKTGEVRCTDERIEMCTGTQWLDMHDCAEDGMLCNATLKMCVEACENGDYKCFDNLLSVCKTDRWSTKKNCHSDMCDADKKACVCEEGSFKCTDNQLMKCVDSSWTMQEDCGEFSCRAEEGKCGYECMDEDPDTCLSLTTKQSCEGHRLVTQTCGSDERCTDGKCAFDPCTLCKDTEVCVDGACLDKPVDTTIGKPCTCTGSDCTITITGKEFNAAVKYMAQLVVGTIGATEQITAPNFFASSITGCEGLTAPAGMQVGCLLNSQLRGTEGMTSWLDGLSTALNGMSKKPLADVISKISNILKKSIDFSAPNGYCFTAAMNPNLSMYTGSTLVSTGLNTDKLEPLVDKFDAGDYATAKVTTCPPGSVLIPDINKTGSLAGYGTLTLDMAMCLRQCITDDDCRKDDGYSCLNWHDQKVCFIQSTIDSIHEMEESFGLVNK